MNAQTVHAAWCDTVDPALCAGGVECYWHPEDADTTAAYDSAFRNGRPVVVAVTLARALDPDARNDQLPERDTATVNLGIQIGDSTGDWAELTIAEARRVADVLSRACDMADVDAEQVHG